MNLPIEEAVTKAISPVLHEIARLKQVIETIELQQKTSYNVDEELLTDKELAKMLKIGVSTVHHKVKNEPNFPKPIKIGNLTRWTKKSIFDYIKSLEKGQRCKQSK